MAVIGVDVDDTVLDLLNPWVKLYNDDFDDNLGVDDITEWDFAKFVKPRAREKIYNYIKYSAIFKHAEPILGAREAIDYLKAMGHRIVYITANNPDNVKQQWLKDHGFMADDSDFFQAYDKSLINVDVLIDDKYDNVRDTPGVGILFTQPHNKKYDWQPRANTWKDVVYIIKGKLIDE